MAKTTSKSDEGFVSLLPEGNKSQGSMEIIRASKLEAEGKTGLVAEGILEKTEPNKFDPSKKDYFVRSPSNTLYIINETKSIKDQLGQDGVLGMYVKVNYDGKVETKNKKGFHMFSCQARKATPNDSPTKSK
jgi:hypothetical protein